MTLAIERPVETELLCPNGLPWCVNHEVDADGFHSHRTATSDIRADRLGFLTPHDVAVLDAHAVLVNNVDGTPDPVVWLSAKFPLPAHVYTEDGIGFSPARAREVGLLFIQLADNLDGGVTAVPRYAPGAHPCREGVAWCNDEAAASDENHTTHWSGEQYLPATGGLMPNGKICGASHVAVLLGQDVRKGVEQEPTIALNVAYNTDGKGDSDDAEMTLDEAERLALFLLSKVAMLRGGEVR